MGVNPYGFRTIKGDLLELEVKFIRTSEEVDNKLIRNNKNNKTWKIENSMSFDWKENKRKNGVKREREPPYYIDHSIGRVWL